MLDKACTAQHAHRLPLELGGLVGGYTDTVEILLHYVQRAVLCDRLETCSLARGFEREWRNSPRRSSIHDS
jgi:hypothetical protein